MLRRAHKPAKVLHIDPKARLQYAKLMGESAPHAMGYIRVSTDEQAVEGISLDVQKDRIIQWRGSKRRPQGDIVVGTLGRQLYLFRLHNPPSPGPTESTASRTLLRPQSLMV